MFPVLFESSFLFIESLWLFVAIAFVVGSITFIKLAKKNGLRLQFILDHGFKILLISIIFSRLVVVIRNFDIFFYDFKFSNLQYIFYIWDKELSFWGAIFGFFLSLRYFCKKNDENFNQWLDISIISSFLAISIGCIGLFLDGRSYGIESSLPWAINFQNISVRFSVQIHPTQLYAFIYNIILFAVFYQINTKHIFKHRGDLFLAAVSSFSLLKFLEEFIRGDDANIILGLREPQIYALIIGLISLYLLLDRYHKLGRIKKMLPFKKKLWKS